LVFDRVFRRLFTRVDLHPLGDGFFAAANGRSKSSALLSDSLDNFGDALTYGVSIHAVSRGNAAKAKVALFRGGLIFLAACAVAVQIVSKLHAPSVSSFEIMGTFSLLGRATNALCLFVHRTLLLG